MHAHQKVPAVFLQIDNDILRLRAAVIENGYRRPQRKGEVFYIARLKLVRRRL